MPADSPREIDMLFEKAIKSGDFDAVMELYEPGAVFPWRQDERYEGAEAIRKPWDPIVASKPQNEFEIKRVLAEARFALGLVFQQRSWLTRLRRI